LRGTENRAAPDSALQLGGGAKTNLKYGARLESTVTWTLTPVAGGTLVRMVHDGFGPDNDAAYDAMSPGWSRILDRIGEIVASSA